MNRNTRQNGAWNIESICLLRILLVPQLASAKIKCQLCYICEEKRLINLSHTQHASRALIAQPGRNSSCEYFYWSLGCQQLTSSSCDVRVHFRVARQCYFKCKSNAVGHFHVLFKLKCVSLRLFTVKTLLFLKICTLEFMLHWGKPTMKIIGSFPADQWDRLVESKAGFSSIHPSTVELESELRPK